MLQALRRESLKIWTLNRGDHNFLQLLHHSHWDRTGPQVTEGLMAVTVWQTPHTPLPTPPHNNQMYIKVVYVVFTHLYICNDYSMMQVWYVPVTLELYVTPEFPLITRTSLVTQTPKRQSKLHGNTHNLYNMYVTPKLPMLARTFLLTQTL